jgi:hypothetical protein
VSGDGRGPAATGVLRSLLAKIARLAATTRDHPP